MKRTGGDSKADLTVVVILTLLFCLLMFAAHDALVTYHYQILSGCVEMQYNGRSVWVCDK